MKKEITFFELLQMKKDGNAPDVVMYHGARYNKTVEDYIVCANDINKAIGGVYLSTVIGKKYGMGYMLENEMIEFDVFILTDKEREYLSAVLKPFKEREMRITKMDSAEGYNLVVDGEEDEAGVRALYYFPVFPHDSEMYRGMEVDRAYTPSELGLWEEDA